MKLFQLVILALLGLMTYTQNLSTQPSVAVSTTSSTSAE